MEDDPWQSPTTLDPVSNSLAGQSARNRGASLIDRVLRSVQQHSYSVCDVYLRLRGICDDLPPSITVAIPVTEEAKKLTRTIESLLSARYIGLRISLVGSREAAKIIDTLPRSANIQFLETQPETSATRAIRAILLEATTPIVAWLKPGETLTPLVLWRLGEIFRQNRRVGCVLVPEPAAFLKQPLPGSSLDFAFLWAQDLSSSVKIFVRRELFWGATRTFVGTDHDLNDWAVALNTARFSRVQLPAGEFYESAGTTGIRSAKENQEIKSTINAKMWLAERFRRSVQQRFLRALRRFAARSPEERAKMESRKSKGLHAPPPVFIESLAGFSTGQDIDLIGTYRWLLAGQPPIARNVFFDQANELLVFQQLTGQERGQNGSAVEEFAVTPEIEQRSQTLAQGLTNVLQGLPEPLREEFGDRIRILVFPIADPGPLSPQSLTPGGIGSSRSAVAQPKILAPSTNPFGPMIDRSDHNFRQSEDVQIATFEQLFDFVVMERPLNVSLSPHVLLRAGANRLKWEGWLIFGCTVFDIQTVRAGWAKSALMMGPNQKLALSRKSLWDLLCVAGFTPRHVLGLTESQIMDSAFESAAKMGDLRPLTHRLFQADASSKAEEEYLLLACQRTF